MILSKLDEFFAAYTIPAAGTVIPANGIDTITVRNLGNGQPLYWYLASLIAATGGTSIQANLVTADNAALTTNLTIHDETPVLPLATLTGGKILFESTLPALTNDYREFLGVQLIVVGTFTAGTIQAGLTLEPKAWRAYPQGVQ